MRRTKPKTEFRKAVEKQMIDMDMTFLGLAEAMGISDPYLRDILDDARKAPERKKQIAKILGLSEQVTA